VQKHDGPVHRLLDRFFAGMDRGYRAALELALHWRWSTLVVAGLLFLGGILLFTQVGKELAPQQDEGRFLISMRTPLGSSIEYTDRKLREVEAITKNYPEIVTEWGIIGLGSAQQVNQATLVIRMLPKAERRARGMRSQQQVLTALRRELTQVAGIRAFPRPFGVFQGQRTEPLQFVVTGPNLMEMGRHAADIQRQLQADPAIGRMDTDLQLELPQYILAPDRTRTQAFGLSAQDVAGALNMLTGGIDIAKYNDDPGDGQRYDVRVKAADGEFVQQSDLSKIYLRNRQGQLIRLDSVASFKEVLGPAVIGKFDLEYAATFYNIPAITLGAAIDKVNEAAATLPPGYRVQFIGEAAELGKTERYVMFAFVVGSLLLFMVLASQFNSFVQPLIIMLAVPLAIIGGIFALWVSQPIAQFATWLGAEVTPLTLNIFSMIGLVLLIGLVAKNSILLVDLTNQRRAEGLGVDAALRDACPIRMRPVLMTSATIVLALLPAALGFGSGSETNQPLAVAVIGGMITSTLLTLVVVPAAYSLVETRDIARPLRRWLPARAT
jgi:HAE1 family hydrophobic/amphiphilic exporter-1